MDAATSTKRRSNRRWWASAFLAVAAAGAFASSSAAQAGELSYAAACPASQISVSYEVGIDSTLGAYAVTGIRITGYPTQCAGQRVAVTVHDAAGAALGTATGALQADSVLAMTARAPVSAAQADRLTIAPAV
ncbi:hypothetical protein BH11ACT1_BH11ACT1_16030 [soil metagenome]